MAMTATQPNADAEAAVSGVSEGGREWNAETLGEVDRLSRNDVGDTDCDGYQLIREHAICVRSRWRHSTAIIAGELRRATYYVVETGDYRLQPTRSDDCAGRRSSQELDDGDGIDVYALHAVSRVEGRRRSGLLRALFSDRRLHRLSAMVIEAGAQSDMVDASTSTRLMRCTFRYPRHRRATEDRRLSDVAGRGDCRAGAESGGAEGPQDGPDAAAFPPRRRNPPPPPLPRVPRCAGVGGRRTWSASSFDIE